MRCWSLFLVLFGCRSPVDRTLSSHVAETVPTVRLVALEGATAKFIRVSGGGVEVEREVKLPAMYVQGLVWRGKDPLVMLVSEADEDDVVTIDSRGFHSLALPPFVAAPKPEDPDATETLHHELTVDTKGVVWRGRCDYWGGYDGGACVVKRYMNVATPATPLFTDIEPERSRALPPVEPSHTIRVSLVDEPAEPPDPDRDPDASPQEPRKLLRCTSGSTTVEYPPADHRDRDQFYGMSDLTWISTDPPIFRAISNEAGFIGVEIPVVFEGCKMAPAYDDAEIVVGPEEVVAFRFDDRLVVRWHGRELGAVPLVRTKGEPPQGEGPVPTLAFQE